MKALEMFELSFSTFNFQLSTFNVKVVGVGPHRPKGRSRSTLWNPRFLRTAAAQVGVAVFQDPE
ncbi:hypothetical protein GCM10011328_12890 [Hafnia psychrotolerans]|uniref:Uncharacterized protein n=1 Tax=Hafnia psychrotolerans TaxID=1477018 RepID=A0ABQ1G9I1_9GAMM|nr:hypothetical protein GCM10011328_12890 [Hafnia psychrotolerans]